MSFPLVTDGGLLNTLKVKAVNKFKALIGKDKSRAITSILGDQGGAHFSHPPTTMPKDGTSLLQKSHSFNAFGEEHPEGVLEIQKLSHNVNKLKVGPIPTLSIDDTTKAEEPKEISRGRVFL